MQLFHYTDVDAVKSILENKRLWLTDVRFLNDTQEMHDGVSSIIDYVKHQSDKFPSRHELFVDAADFLIDSLSGSSGYKLSRRPVFVCSFSRAADLLSQWRAYGSYAIEFADDAMPSGLLECVYDPDEKLTRTANVALESLMVIADDKLQNDGFLDRPGFDAFSNLVELAATFKHISFSEEQEVRLVAGHDIDPDIDEGLKIEFRSRSNVLIPYVEVGITLESIKAIHIGPMKDQELAYISLKAFVDKIQSARIITKDNFGHEIEIIKSSIPYRAP